MNISSTSRYAGAGTRQVPGAAGASVTALVIPAPRSPLPIGYHPRVAGERLDLIALRYLNSPTGFWRLCDANNAMVPGALEARTLIGVPEMGG